MASPYPPTYYAAATTEIPAAHPPLQGEAAADVCVIGGGFSGLNTAIELAERGRSVILLEAERIGWGASGRNGGQLQGGFLAEPRMARVIGAETVKALKYRGNEIAAARIARYAIACDWREGHIECAAKPRHFSAMAASFDRDDPMLELVEKPEMPGAIGTDKYHGGIINRHYAHLNPLKLALGEARAAQSLGVRIYEGTKALDIAPGDMKAGRKAVVATAQGVVRASAVVLAGDALHHLIARVLDGAIIPAASYIIATEPLAPDLLARAAPQGLCAHDTLNILDYWRPSPDGRMIYGGRADYANRPLRDIIGAIRPRMIATYPELAGARIDHAWGGVIGVTFTRAPQFGRAFPDVYYLQGYSGHGLNVAHLGAEIVARAICGESERLDLFQRLPMPRLPGGSRFANPALALGMLWHRLMDRL